MATLLVIVISIVSLAVYSIAQFLIAQSEPDEFAKELKIPTNIPMNLPVNMGTDDLRPDSLLKRKVTAKDFQLYNSFQPGLYQFDFWVGKIEKGTLYLKAFEVTQDLALSAESLHERSSVAIYNPTDSVKRFGTTRHFTIYEGDWGSPYAARFEVWFKPDNKREERRLYLKNYKIEGWMH
jgi:hypothetical protein